jgi:hypothetical protein
MIKINYKYYLFKYHDNKIKKVLRFNKKEEMKKELVGKKLNKDAEYILTKISKEKSYTENKSDLSDKSNKLNIKLGPIKVVFKIMEINENGIMKPKYEKQTNSRGKMDPDKRNAQFVYISTSYYEKNGIKSTDIMEVSRWAILNKLEKRLLAPKFIDQIH